MIRLLPGPLPGTRRSTTLAATLVLSLLAAPGAIQAADPAPPSAVRLTLRQALELGLERNVRVLLGDAQAAAARGAELQAAARLRPQFRLEAGGSRQVIDLEAYGFPTAPGESPLVGPYSVLDLRGAGEMVLFDAAARETVRAAGARADAARWSAADARDLVVLACGNLYLRALAERGRIEAAAAELETAEAVDRLAHDRRDAGSAAALDLLRAGVELEAARARETAARAGFEKAKLLLAHTIGLPPGSPLELADELRFVDLSGVALPGLLATARRSRADLQAAEARVTAATHAVTAARESRWPTLVARGDWGRIGPRVDSVETTWTIGAQIRLPLLEGGATEGRRIAAAAELAARQAELDDLGRQVDVEVRSALLDLDTASRLAASATAARDLAGRQLEVARDRFAAGLGDSLDVVSAQQAVAAADEARLGSLYQHNAAKAVLARALGLADEDFIAIFEGRTDDLSFLRSEPLH